MRRLLLVIVLPLGLGGCLSLSSSAPERPASNTVVVPNGYSAVCANGSAPPC